MAGRLQSLLVLAVFLLAVVVGVSATLRQDHYAKTCPDVEKIVRKAVEKKFKQTFVTLPGVLRTYFHDSSNGCDASLLVAPTPTHSDTERTHPDNLSLAPDGYDTINKAKEALEKNPKCKGKVSCADIFTIAARDVIQLGGGPFYKVELGRYDSKISKASKVHLPGPEMNLDQQIAIYKTMGLDATDLTALSMAHSFGFAHCEKFSHRLYNFNNKKKQDPTLNSDYAMDLKKMCPKHVDPRVAISFDPMTPKTLDNIYYKNLAHGMGLLTSDQVLFQDKRTKGLVLEWADNQKKANDAFTKAMIKLGRNKVLTKKEGVIRTHCDRFN